MSYAMRAYANAAVWRLVTVLNSDDTKMANERRHYVFTRNLYIEKSEGIRKALAAVDIHGMLSVLW
jgi:hypothetical protein